MKCINLKKKLILPCTAAALLCGCGTVNVPVPYGTLDNNADYALTTTAEQAQVPLFAEKLCAAVADVTESSTIDTGSLKAACVYDIDATEVLYSYQAFERLSPASLTKVMTALLVLENCPDLDEIITIGDVAIREEGAQNFGFKEGDRISIRDLLYVTLVYSANDGALALAQHVGGTMEAFADMMNARAEALGATHSHFMNPHGLTNDEHYTCAYDLYLIFQAAVQQPEFQKIIQTEKYSFSYISAANGEVSKEISTTNQYFLKGYESPATVSVLGGKTGSTAAAGKCIILYLKSMAGHPYIAVVMGAESFDGLYQSMTQLCNETIE
ncbi:MAG: D-alanyl-D-alanine carboxypeptidase [Lachnospiraceae bacterium]|nr:D-alanyl-D-alanine carboxypeptidase [Lachnospiraceae bacterium]